jgi:histone H3/H4
MSDHLVVVSKVKALIKDRFDLSTSAAAIDVLSTIVEKECVKASENAKRNQRKTVLDRDFM